MYDEKKYPTLKIMKCNNCGHVFNSSLDGSTDCPECESRDTKPYRADEESGNNTSEKSLI